MECGRLVDGRGAGGRCLFDWEWSGGSGVGETFSSITE